MSLLYLFKCLQKPKIDAFLFLSQRLERFQSPALINDYNEKNKKNKKDEKYVGKLLERTQRKRCLVTLGFRS